MKLIILSVPFKSEDHPMQRTSCSSCFADVSRSAIASGESTRRNAIWIMALPVRRTGAKQQL